VDAYFTWLSPDQRTTIFNAVTDINQAATTPDIVLPNDKRHLITLGRLKPQKNQQLLIRAFAMIAHEYPDWRLCIVGDGPEREPLQALIEELGMSVRITLTGSTTAPFAVLKQADIFVLSSLFEGMPNALLEAMACGLPVITTDYRGGPQDIIQRDADGIIVPSDDVSALAAAMSQLMGDAAHRQRLADGAREVVQRFSLDRILDQWEATLMQVANR
jgi:glycosyltransferase involved in cell wall biosynthesis